MLPVVLRRTQLRINLFFGKFGGGKKEGREAKNGRAAVGAYLGGKAEVKALFGAGLEEGLE